MKPYALITPSNEYTPKECIDRLKRTIARDQLNPDDYYFCQQGWIPEWLLDSFSKQFLGEDILLTVAYRKLYK